MTEMIDAATTLTRALRLTIAGEPKRKERPRFDSRSRRTYTPDATVQAANAIGWEVKAAASAQGFDLPLDGPVAVEMMFRTAVPEDAVIGVKDGDNLEKLVCDALNGVAWTDDRQVVEMHWKIERGSNRPCTEIAIRSALRRLEAGGVDRDPMRRDEFGGDDA